MNEDRHSSVEEPDLIDDPDEKALAEARNALRQFDIGMVLLEHWLDNKEKRPRIRVSDLLYLNRFALEDINRFAGTFRTQAISISGSSHVPPPPVEVPTLCEDLCDYLNENWNRKSAIHLSAYALWRINWIHPFVDGNGRTARILSYVVLCAKYGFRLPGTKTIPEQIVADKTPYYKALEEADRAFDEGRIDLGAVESLIETGLREQLEDALKENDDTGADSARAVAIADADELLITSSEARREALLLTLKIEPPAPSKNFIERNPVVWTGIFSLVSVLAGVLLASFLG